MLKPKSEVEWLLSSTVDRRDLDATPARSVLAPKDEDGRARKPLARRRQNCGALMKRGNRAGQKCGELCPVGYRRCANHRRPGTSSRPLGSVPRTSGLYAKYLVGDELFIYLNAPVGNVDDQIKVAKAKLGWALQQWRDNPLGGIELTQGPNRGSLKLWQEICIQHLEAVRRLEETKKKIEEKKGEEIPIGGQSVTVLVNMLAKLPEAEQRKYLETGVIDIPKTNGHIR